jgi:hypothetical protein
LPALIDFMIGLSTATLALGGPPKVLLKKS